MSPSPEIGRPDPLLPVPSNARKAFSGVIFDIYQWEQTLFDGSTVTFETAKRPDTTLIIPVTTEGTILSTAQQQPGREPFYTFAGGRIDLGENPEQAARRELLEETGYQAQDLVLLNATQVTSKIDWAVFTFIARGCQKVAERHPEAGEQITIFPLSFDEFLELASTDRFPTTHLNLMVLKARLDPQRLLELRRLMFGQ